MPKTAKLYQNKKVLFIHYRVGRTDGVSLQISSWQEILTGQGAQVELLAGPISSGATYTIGDLEQQLNPDIFAIDEAAFSPLPTEAQQKQFIEAVLTKQNQLKDEILLVLKRSNPDLIICSNLFSVGENLPAAGALTMALDEHPIPTIAVLHDFYWENNRYEQPSCAFVEQQLERYFPPRREWLQICCINSIAKASLKQRKQLDSSLLYDTFDFNQPAWRIDDFNRDLLSRSGYDPNDLIILQATRIVRRKNIELAIDLIHQLNQPQNLKRLATSTLANQKNFNPSKNRLVLMLAGYAEERDRWYQEKLLQYAHQQAVETYFIGDLIEHVRIQDPKQYSLWDAYPFADLITYPSEYEGFGNQFLEAVFAQKPTVVFEYPVFLSDIKPKGFQVVSLGQEASLNPTTGLMQIPLPTLEYATNQVIDILTKPQHYQQLVQTNLRLGRQHFSYQNALAVFQARYQALTPNR